MLYKDCMEYQPVEFHISQKRGLHASYHTKSGKSDKVPGENEILSHSIFWKQK